MMLINILKNKEIIVFFLFRKVINKIKIRFEDFIALEKCKRNVQRHYMLVLQNSL